MQPSISILKTTTIGGSLPGSSRNKDLKLQGKVASRSPEKMAKFEAPLKIIGINPYVSLPREVLENIFVQAGREKGFIPVTGSINRKKFKQTLVKYAGRWRLYINTSMLKGSPKRIGETISISIRYDSSDRTVETPATLAQALNGNPAAKAVFEKLPPSRKKEISRYIANLKTPESMSRNIEKAIAFLTGKGRFVGRANP